MFQFLKTADHKLWYMFYIKDVNERLRPVDADWDGGGWVLSAVEFHDQVVRGADNHVLSRN